MRGTLFKIANEPLFANFVLEGFHPRGRSDDVGVDGRSLRISFFEGGFFGRGLFATRGFTLPRPADAAIDLSTSASNSKTNVPSSFFFSRTDIPRYNFDNCIIFAAQVSQASSYLFFTRYSCK